MNIRTTILFACLVLPAIAGMGRPQDLQNKVSNGNRA
jgi:hypothetical protein